jgi:hypothetical protein
VEERQIVVILLLITLTNPLSAGFVFARHPQEKANSVFALTGFSLALWTLTNVVFKMPKGLPQVVLNLNLLNHQCTYRL